MDPLFLNSTPAGFSIDGEKLIQNLPLSTAVHTPSSEWGLSQVRSVSLENHIYKLLEVLNNDQISLQVTHFG